MNIENLNCCQKAAFIVCRKYKVMPNKKELLIIKPMGEGFGIGGICGAAAGAVIGAVMVLNKDCGDDARGRIVMGFMEKYSSLSCSKLFELYGQNNCSDIIDFSVSKACEYIDEIKNTNFDMEF